MNHVDLTPFLQALIGLIATIITCMVIPWIRARTTGQQKKNLQAIVRTLVFAAEQLYGAGKGAEKLDYVIAWLEDHGFKADRAEIEAAVYEAFNSIPPIDDIEYDVNIAHWPLEQLISFCELNNINTDNCVTREDYMDAIEHGGRVSDEPPTSAAESRE